MGAVGIVPPMPTVAPPTPTPAPTLTPPALEVPMLMEPNGPTGTLIPTPTVEQAGKAAMPSRQAAAMKEEMMLRVFMSAA